MKKMLGTMMLTLLLLALGGCSSDNDDVIYTEAYARSFLDLMQANENETGIRMEIYPPIIFIDSMPAFLATTLTNLSDNNFATGYHQTIDFFDGTEWVRAMPPQVASDVQVHIKPSQMFELTSHSLDLIEDLTIGKYRLVHFHGGGEYQYAIFFVVQ